MSNLLEVLHFITVIGFVGLFFLMRSLVRPYVAKKGENLATKEDVEDITAKVERVRTQHASELESLRSRLQSESDVLARRRQVYDGMVQSLGAFVSGRTVEEVDKQRFLNEYASMWLWADDQIVRALNEFLKVNILYAKDPNPSLQPLLRHGYASCILAMRKEVGFRETALVASDYQFVSFSTEARARMEPLQASASVPLPPGQTQVFLDGTVIFSIALPDDLTAREQVAAQHLAKIIGPAVGTGQAMEDITSNAANHASLQVMADAAGISVERLLEIAQGIRLIGTQINGKIRDFPFAGGS